MRRQRHGLLIAAKLAKCREVTTIAKGWANKGNGPKTALASLFTFEHHLSALLVCFFILLMVFLVLARTTPEVWGEWLGLRARWNTFQALLKDPRLGAPLPLSEEWQPVNGIPLPPLKTPILLVFFRGCQGCPMNQIKEWAETLGRWRTWRWELSGVLVIQDEPQKVKEVSKREGWQVAVVVDKDGTLARRLNAVFAPRAYGFVNGKLVWLQKDLNMGVVSVLNDFLKVTKGEAKAKAIFNTWSAEMRERTWGKEAAARAHERQQ